MTCRLIDLRALRAAEPERFAALWRDFRPIYIEAFPTPSEREDETTWLPWLDRDDPPPQPWFDLSLALAPESDSVLGAPVYEYYRGRNARLSTYLLVRRERRGRGIGRTLAEHMHTRMRAMARASGADAPICYAEAQDPDLLDAEHRASARERLAIYARLGARRLDIPYVQPALAPGKVPARHLTLLAFGVPEVLGAAPVLRFLAEYYRALEIAAPDSDPDFRRARTAAREKIRTYIPNAAR